MPRTRSKGTAPTGSCDWVTHIEHEEDDVGLVDDLFPRPPFLTPFPRTSMSSTVQATSSTPSSSNIQLITDALADYANITGILVDLSPGDRSMSQSIIHCCPSSCSVILSAAADVESDGADETSLADADYASCASKESIVGSDGRIIASSFRAACEVGNARECYSKDRFWAV
ncbi:hypothetical protein BGY98DRAFT_938590 [Russula aff. rugulosa BPL654]|nr:hypothetical protein BGY98DRAFT_938590 [Russula aff. rugulosa BPL654]